MANKFALAAALTLALAACAPAERIVLLPDPDGHVGRIEVSTPAGSQVLAEARTGTTVDPGKAPTAPKPVTEAEIAKTWGAATAAMPALPVRFQLYFKTGTAELTEAGQAELPKVLAAVKSRPHPRVLVAGHADAVGSDLVNIKVSGERAQAVRDLLVKDGLDGKLVTTESHGKRVPLVPTPDGVAEPRNRRVTVTVQ